MEPITTENYFEAARGLHWYCTDYHGGQWSKLYRIQCQLDYRPGGGERGTDEESQPFYDALVSGEIDPEETLAAIQLAYEKNR
jgi:hypothetical protein